MQLDDHWRLTLASDTSLPGWLVLVPRRHLEGLHELNRDEAEGLGRLLRASSAALVEVTVWLRTYPCCSLSLSRARAGPGRIVVMGLLDGEDVVQSGDAEHAAGRGAAGRSASARRPAQRPRCRQ